jgi:hypothetical protein
MPDTTNYRLTDVEEAIRRAAWDAAVDLAARLDQARHSARGGMGARGYRDPWAVAEARRLLTLLRETVAEHGFTGAGVDPDAPWQARQEQGVRYPYEAVQP